MRFYISQFDALRAIQNVIGSTEKRDYMQILSYVKIDTLDKKIKLTTTNLDMQSSDFANAETESNFSFVAPIQTLLEIVKKMPDNSKILFEFNEKNNKLTIESDKCKFEIGTLSVSDFPVMSETDYNSILKINAIDFLFCLRNTQFSMSNEDIKYNLNGILIHSDEKEINCISTDGHRLSCCSIANENNVEIANSIIPKKAVFEIIKILSLYQNDQVEIKLSEKKICISIKNITFVSKLIDASFPDYKKVIPLQNDKILEINIKKLKNSIERVSIVNMHSDNKGMLFNVTPNSLSISSTIDSDAASETIDVKFSSDESMNIKYNFKYILDSINHINDENCVFKISNPENSILITQKTPDSKKNLYFIIMPMRK